MKYSLRGLMIGVTLICVVLGGLMGRIEYLRRWAAFHDSRQRNARNLVDEFHHFEMAEQYRDAMHRPWTIVKESPAP
jgi:hypothetical protein